jgi:hypothetical protein
MKWRPEGQLSSRECYPLTRKLQEYAITLNFPSIMIPAVEQIVLTFGEYEHDGEGGMVSDLHSKMTLDQLYEVYIDLLLVLSTSDPEEGEDLCDIS